MEKYIIKKGCHYSGLHFGGTFKNKVKFKASFDSNCLYSLSNNDTWDVNKLFGFSTSWNHMKQSARIGWRSYGHRIQLFAFVHDKGKFLPPKLLGAVSPGEEFRCEIHDNFNDYLFVFDSPKDHTHFNIIKTYSNILFRYTLYPYFGGNQPAPHYMSIHLEELTFN